MIDSYENSLAKILNHQSIDPIPNTRYKRLICSKIFEQRSKCLNGDEQPKVFAFDQIISRHNDCSFQFELVDNIIILFKANNHHVLYQINPKFYDELQPNSFVEEIANRIDRNISFQKVIRCQFYPYDLGLYSSLTRERLSIFDTIRQDLVQTLPVRQMAYKKQFYQMDWNRLTFVSIALACDNSETLIFDHRTDHTSLTLAVNDPCTKNNESTRCQVVYWSPQDAKGLFIGTRAGSIILYDIRQPRKPLAAHLSSYLYRHPVAHISMSPDHRNIITMHPTYNTDRNIFRWKISPNFIETNRFLKEMPLFVMKKSSHPNVNNVSSFRKNNRHKLEDIHFEHMQPYITNEQVSLFSRIINGQIETLNYTFEESKKYDDESVFMRCTNFWPKKLSLSSIDDDYGHHPRSSSLFFGYGSTNKCDEQIPAIFCKANKVFLVRRLRLTNNGGDDDVQRNFRKIQPMEIQDRWSSDSD